MLIDLSIRDVVLIDRLDLSFDDGLAVLTGETGAGKSILLDSLGLALGARAEARLVRHGSKQAVVSAAFSLPQSHTANLLLDEQGLDIDETLVLRRVLKADGRSRAYANDQPISISLLKLLGECLIEIQGQFDQQGLMDSTTHIDVLDSYANLHEDRQACAGLFKHWKETEKALHDARRAAEKAREDEDYLRYSVDELEKFAPQPGEEDTLSAERTMLQNAEKLIDAINEAHQHLDGRNGADALLRKAQKALERIADKATGQVDSAIEALERAAVEIQEGMSGLSTAMLDIRPDDSLLNATEERLFALRDLARKHNAHPDQLADVLEQLQKNLLLIDDSAAELAKLEEEATAAKQAYIAAADSLSSKRRSAAEQLDKAVNAELPPLKLEKATFVTVLEEMSEDAWTASGKDRVQFQVSTNPGTPAGPLSKIASGGELSRFLLALKVSLAETGSVPTLVFDEVDSGVGGATAAAVGERLDRLSESVQILVITHSPQVAARGQSHWRVAKSLNGEAMVTAVSRLDDAERREELARMLSGAEVTNEARAAADRLLADRQLEGTDA